MRLGEGKTYKQYYIIVEKNDFISEIVAKQNGRKTTTKLGMMDQNNILIFEKKKEAIDWIDTNSYKGMTQTYVIKKIINDKTTSYKWEVA
jgi:hypothetical protein